MWIDICTQKNSSQNFLFPHLSSLLSTVRCLPHSNAESERIFSMLSDIKSKKRNKIGVDLLNSMRVVRTSLKARGETSRTMSVDDRPINLMSGKQLYV
ncbi:hypothetical protein WH47_09222 [Habropoda laboriosa]|uniref:HAT C-terminal dimerisation domain-containing protein n=1 Tax=Habropoda laboriosa TaxID=597456 RepID=A0A0L7QJ87_9HYME|nr:hypothetical protein WH47_09222 [Habropoda laboriosa]